VQLQSALNCRPGALTSRAALAYRVRMSAQREVEVVFEPQPEGGFTVYSPDLPGMVTEGDTMEQATANAQEAIELYVESMRERGKQVPLGVVRRNFALPV
jgi:antitoxin HicB